jgi:hypothetical protein
MRITLAILAMILSGMPALRAQAPAPVSLVLNPPAAPGGTPSLVVNNTGTVTVTAVALSHWLLTTGAPPKSPAVMLLDAALQPSWQPVLAGQQAAVPFGLATDPMRPAPAIIAALFIDGSSWGDASSIKHLVAQRGYALQRLTEAVQDLQQALAQGTSRDAVVSQIQSSLNQSIAAAANADDRMAVRMARNIGLRNIENATAPLAQVLGAEIDSLKARLVKLRSYGNLP